MMIYRFHCWEQQNRTYMPSLVASCTRTGRVAYFESDGELTLDISSMAITPYETDSGEPLLALMLRSRPSRQTLYAPLHELSNFIASEQNDTLWRMIRMTARLLAPKHHLA